MSTAISGVYMNPHGWLPIPGVTVRAYSEDGFTEGSATTDSNGKFSITGLTDRNWLAKTTSAAPDFGVLLLLPNTVFHDNLSNVGADQHHAGFIGIKDNSSTIVSPDTDDYIKITDDGVINVDKTGEVDGILGLTIDQSQIDHSSIDSLAADDHEQYAHLTGRSGGQEFFGGMDANDDLTIGSTADATKGNVYIGDSSLFDFDETNGQLKLPTSGSSAGLLLGGDALLYRVSANLLRTPDGLTVDGALTATSGDVDGAVSRAIQLVAFDFTTDVTTGDGKYYFHVDSRIAGMDLVDVHAEVITAGTTGTTDIQIHNVTSAADILSTKLTIDSGETGSDTAATPAVINTAEDDMTLNDMIRIDVDAVSSTAPKGLLITLGFSKP